MDDEPSIRKWPQEWCEAAPRWGRQGGQQGKVQRALHTQEGCRCSQACSQSLDPERGLRAVLHSDLLAWQISLL